MRAPVAAGYCCLVLIWATVPLAVKWSVTGSSFSFAALSRFLIAVPLLAVWLLFRGAPFPCTAPALWTYALAGLNFLTFVAIFWGAQFVPSGWLGLVWGISPFVTALLARWLLGEHSLGVLRVGGMCLGIAGMALVFDEARVTGPGAARGLVAMLAGVVCSAATSVAVKRIDADVPPFAVTLGGGCLALPAYALVWVLAGAPLPAEPDGRTVLALLYVAVPGTGIVFSLLYYVLRHARATQVSLIGMISPVLALIVGNFANGEAIGWRVGAGTVVILAGLVLHEYLPRRQAGGT